MYWLKKYPLVLLAAGKSSRVGEPKGLIKFKNKTWLEWQVENFHKVGGEKVVLVLGYWKEEYLRVVEKMDLSNIDIIVNEKPERGQFSSVQVGLKKCMKNEACFLMPIDVPVPEKEVWRVLGQEKTDEIDVCIPVYKKKGGHPILISSVFQKEMLKLNANEKSSRLDWQIKKWNEDNVIRLPVFDNKVIMNFNTLEDFEIVRGDYA